MAAKQSARPILKKRISTLKVPNSNTSTENQKSQAKPSQRTIHSSKNSQNLRNTSKKLQSLSPNHVVQSSLGNLKQTNYDKQVEEKFDQILEGDLTDLLPLPRSTVRIFLSSTFSDTRAERNGLAREAYPKLRDYCTELGLSFQVVDLRWGVTSEATNNHLTTKICLLELENCQKVSVGPSCIALIGNRYGFCPLPYKISVEEYNVLKSEANELGLTDFDLLDRWYQRDDNSIPAAYYLQPITSILPHFLNTSLEFKSQKEIHTEKWSKVEKQMLNIIYKTACSASDKNKISAERKHFYLQSVTEHEVRAGIIVPTDPNKHGLVFIRELDDFNSDNYHDSNASRYKDLINNHGEPEADLHAESQIRSLKEELHSTLNPSNIVSYTVPWQPGGINPEKFTVHKEYISQFCSDFVTKVKSMIDSDVLAKESSIRQGEYYSSFEEILHHAHFCRIKSETFCGQSDTLGKIKEYILDPANRKPFVIHAQSGAGKTSVMAMAMNSLKLWIKEDNIGIIRFLGTTSLSTDIYNVLFSVCGQLADITETVMEPQSYRTMKALATYLPRFFRTISSIAHKPVIIFLDSLDQLESKFDAYTAWWLPASLPLNFKLVVSTLPDHQGIFENIVSLISQKKNLVEVPLLPDVTSQEIVIKYLTLKKRRVTDDQMEFLLQMFKKSPSPLYLKLLMDQAVHWSSSMSQSLISLPDSIRVAINNLFQQLEMKFGLKFVQGALGLLTVGFNGLSEIELEDGLSCMDDVMIEIYNFHDPPVPGIVRVPPVMWARLRYDISEYLVERQSQGMTTLYWYHRQFREVAAERYTQGIMGQILHNVLFELFAAENGVKRDILLPGRNNLHVVNADRNTTPQVTSLKNVRKLQCLTYHLKNSEKVHKQDFVKQATYCNLLFLRTKAVLVGVDKLLREIEDYQSLVQDAEIETIIQFIITCGSSLKDPLTSAFSVLAHIPDNIKYENLLRLKTSAKQYLSDLPKTVLVPSYACLVPRQGEPEKVYVGFSHFLGMKNEQILFVSSWTASGMLDLSVTLACIDVKSTEVSKHFCENISCEPYMLASGKELIYWMATDSAFVKLHIESGKCAKIPVSNIFPGLDGKKSTSCTCIITGSEDSKYLAFCFGDYLALVESTYMKSISLLQQPVKTKVTNVHCCSGAPLTLILTSANDNRGEITFYDGLTKETKLHVQTPFRVESKCSELTLGDEYHVFYGKSEQENIIQVCKVKSEEISEPIKMLKTIQSMKVSEVDQEVYFLAGDSEIHVLNVESKQFIKTLNHEFKIISFDVAWDEDKLLIADVNNSVILFDKKFDILFSHTGTLGRINFISICQDHILLSTLENKIKIWSEKEFFSSLNKADSGTKENILSNQDDVTCFAISEDGKNLITAGTREIGKMWSLYDYSFVSEFSLSIKATNIVGIVDGKFVAHDNQAKRLISFTPEGNYFYRNYPDNVVCFSVTNDKNRLIFLTKDSKQTMYIFDFTINVYLKKFNIVINFDYLSAEMFLSASERYAVFKFEVTPEDFKAIAAMWNKGTRLPKQKHPFRFSAVDLNQGSGKAMHVYHQLSKVPQLGVTIEPYKGNIMMISSRRWVVFWDIPTGSCDQVMCKSPRKTKMYRPDWLGQDCVGSNDIITMSGNKEFVAVGSQDGYVFVYGGESGMPAKMKAPSSRHPSPVNQVCFNFSSSLVASSCTSGYLKLWNPKSGQCIFSVCIGVELGQLEFSPDDKKLLAVTTAEINHVLVLDVTSS
ncbi:hypothetical protein Btru_068995 [Bulinus truncatus]|nr:hypothetical protein Btru_068995 [Bulinus truncatus]